MSAERQQTCCFTGHRPAKLPWGNDERDPRCLAMKHSILRELDSLYRMGYTHFISGMALGCDLYFAEAVLELKEIYPPVTLEAALPFPDQAGRWSEDNRRRWQDILDRCDKKTVVQDHYDRWCMLRRDRYMVDHSALILAVFDGTPGGTKYTLDCAAQQGLDICLLDLNAPNAPAVRLTAEKFENYSIFPVDK